MGSSGNDLLAAGEGDETWLLLRLKRLSLGYLRRNLAKMAIVGPELR